jgi:hypothetical protein
LNLWVTVVKTPFTLFQKQVEMVFWYTVKFTHMSLCLVPKILYSINVIMFVSKQFTVVNSVMLELRNIQRVIASPRIGVNNTIRLYLLPNNREQGICFSIGIITVKTLPLRFKRPKTGTLPAAPRPRFPFRLPPK